MARHKTPDGRRVPVSFKLTEAEAELVDSLRGTTERSVWLREQGIASAEQLRDSRIQKSGPPKAARGSQLAGDDPGEQQRILNDFIHNEADGTPRKRGRKGPCEHRVQPGAYCRRCDQIV